MSYSYNKDQLKIFYFFMLADGKCSEDEIAKFSSICDLMEVDANEREETISFCENAINVSGSNNFAKVISEITKLLIKNGNRLFSLGSLNSNKQKQLETIWTLINLGYADVEYSEAEKEVVSFLADNWKIDSAIMDDLYDTADTILALTMQKSWVKTTNKPYDVVSASIAELDDAINRMADNIKILISESNIA